MIWGYPNDLGNLQMKTANHCSTAWTPSANPGLKQQDEHGFNMIPGEIGKWLGTVCFSKMEEWFHDMEGS